MQGLAPHSMGNTARALAEGGAPHVVRLVVERVVPYEEVDASLVYGWPQLLLPVDGAGGAGAGRGNAEADEEASLGELTFGAVSQVCCASPDVCSQLGSPVHMPCACVVVPEPLNLGTHVDEPAATRRCK